MKWTASMGYRRFPDLPLDPPEGGHEEQEEDQSDDEDANSLIEQIADLIDVGKLELGDCNPEHIAARGTSATAPPVSTAQAVRMATV